MATSLLRITKVEGVQVLHGGETSTINLLLTPDHLVLQQAITPPPPQDCSSPSKAKHRGPPPKENWIAYPMIAFCTFRPTPPGSGHASSIRLRGRDFKFYTLNFSQDTKARDVFESIKAATCRRCLIDKLYAFSYKPVPIEQKISGWEIYDPKAEWKRQGISDKGADRGWRISKINLDYSFSPTYPALLPVPSTISDNTLNYAAKYRSRARIPVLTYLHPVNNCSITRSSQPMAGLRGNRSIQDEKLVCACFSATAQINDLDGSQSTTISRGSPSSSLDSLAAAESNGDNLDTERLEDELIASSSIEVISDEPLSEKPHVYGAQRHNLIVDARPTVNALAMQAIGLGSENMDNYKFATKAYLGIENIHVMRESLFKVIEAIKDSDVSSLPPNRDLLGKSGWLKHIKGLLDGSSLIARQVGIQHSHVLIHCSDGWDRTSQLSALSQLMLDPYFRTIEGFIVLVEKDWLAFGHMFQHRTGYLNSEKWFVTNNEALAGSTIQPVSNGNFLSSARQLFNRNDREDVDSDGEALHPEDMAVSKKASKDDPTVQQATKPKETSPVFHQFLDCTYQLLRQHPTRFEFNDRFLRRLLYHQFSCQYGTFLYNNEKARLDAKVKEKTTSVWAYFLSRKPEFTNPEYNAEIDDHVKGKERLLFPHLNKIRWWHEVFNKSEDEMNGPSNAATERYLAPSISNLGVGGSVLTGVEPSHAAIGAGISRQVSNGSVAAGGFASLREGIAGLGLGIGKGMPGSKSPTRAIEEMEVEMQ